MTKAKMDAIQLGNSGTPARNMHLRHNNDETFTLARGNVGAPLGDILTIGADGSIAMPSTNIAFSAWQSVSHSVGAGAQVKLLCTQEEFDVGGCWDTALSRFTPTKAGYYYFGGGWQCATGSSILRVFGYKNGVLAKQFGGSTPSTDWIYGGGLFYMNGTTDYLEYYVFSQVANTTHPVQWATYIQGHLVAKA